MYNIYKFYSKFHKTWIIGGLCGVNGKFTWKIFSTESVDTPLITITGINVILYYKAIIPQNI